MSFKEARELEMLPGQIEALEAEQEALMQRMSAADYFKSDIAAQQADKARAEALPALIEAAYGRWEELAQKAERCAQQDSRQKTG